MNVFGSVSLSSEVAENGTWREPAPDRCDTFPMNFRRQIALTFASFLASFMLLPPVASRAQDSRAVLLPESAAKQLKQLCSRDAPRVDGVWTPSATVLATMESHIDKIADLESKHGNMSVRVKDPRQNYRQYVGILIGGQRYVYINGMCEKPRGDWHEGFRAACDGGNCFWGVLYNVQSGSFSNLETNGNA
jgi:hypothetical protein